MKKAIALLLTSSLLLAGCSSSSDEEEEVVDFNITELATTAVDNMLNSKFELVAETFDDNLAKQLSASDLAIAYYHVTDEIGAHQSRTSIVVSGTSVEIIEKYKTTSLKFTLSYDDEGKMSGIYINYAASEAVESELYIEEAITVIGDENYPLDGMITIPVGVENPPVVVLVQGSGSSDMNETIYMNTPLRDIAYGLAELGIASIRYDKRYYAYPEAAEEMGIYVTYEDEILEDVMAAIDLVSSDGRFDSDKIVVLGHSLGGMLTPYIATANDDVDAIISMAGTLRPLYEVSYDQNQAIIEGYLNDESTGENLLAVIMSQAEQIEADLEILRGDMSDVADDTLLMGLYASYQKSAKEYAGENFIDEVTVPILVLQGTADFQIYADVDYVLWQETIGERDNVVFKLYTGLNHLMMPTETTADGYCACCDVSDYMTENTVSQDVIDDIAEFINGL